MHSGNDIVWKLRRQCHCERVVPSQNVKIVCDRSFAECVLFVLPIFSLFFHYSSYIVSVSVCLVLLLYTVPFCLSIVYRFFDEMKLRPIYNLSFETASMLQIQYAITLV